jgi:hypothetical protein
MPELITETPPPQDDGWTISSLRMPEELTARVRAEAKRRTLPIAAFVRTAILNELERNQKREVA